MRAICQEPLSSLWIVTGWTCISYYEFLLLANLFIIPSLNMCILSTNIYWHRCVAGAILDTKDTAENKTGGLHGSHILGEESKQRASQWLSSLSHQLATTKPFKTRSPPTSRQLFLFVPRKLSQVRFLDLMHKIFGSLSRQL